MSVAENMVISGHKTRTVLIWGACVFSVAALGIACWLMLKGVNGEFTILGEYKGLTLYMTSLAPGLLFLVCGTAVMLCVVWKKVRMHTNHGDDKGETTVEI